MRGGEADSKEIVMKNPLLREDMTIIGPVLNRRRLRNLVDLVFVEQTDPPSVVVLLDRVAVR